MNISVTAERNDGGASPGQAGGFGAKLSRMALLSGRSRFSVLKEIVALRFGAGRLSPNEYAALRLYDDAIYAGADKRAFAGFRAAQKIWLRANYRFDFYGLVNNKILSDILFGTYGFPIMPTVAIFREGVGRASPFLLRDEAELRAFLAQGEYYPLFGKPMTEHQSHGTASLERYDAAQQRLITTSGHGIPLDAFIGYVKSHAASGYILQRRLSPHGAIRAMCGERLATLRLLTVVTRGEVKLLRACWKIPAGINIADNFWRPGNLLAQLDYDSGRILRVIRGSDAGFEEVTRHPDSGVTLPGMAVPNWREAVQLVTEAGRAVEEMGLIGWDIAPIDSGAVIVEINETPDFKLHQLADKRGIMDAGFMEFLEERKQHAADWLRNSRQKKRIVTELVPPPPGPAVRK